MLSIELTTPLAVHMDFAAARRDPTHSGAELAAKPMGTDPYIARAMEISEIINWRFNVMHS